MFEKIKLNKEDKNVQRDLENHKRKANAFFQHLQTDQEKTITIYSFDCQKNLLLPKIPPDQAAYYYARQFYFYNFGICEGTSKDPQSLDKIFLYTWTEAYRPKGSDEIASAVYHKLTNSDLSEYETVRLFTDGCGGQNKNTTMIGMLMKWLVSTAPQNIQEVQLFFPGPGHSYMPPDSFWAHRERLITDRYHCKN